MTSRNDRQELHLSISLDPTKHFRRAGWNKEALVNALGIIPSFIKTNRVSLKSQIKEAYGFPASDLGGSVKHYIYESQQDDPPLHCVGEITIKGETAQRVQVFLYGIVALIDEAGTEVVRLD